MQNSQNRIIIAGVVLIGVTFLAGGQFSAFLVPFNSLTAVLLLILTYSLTGKASLGLFSGLSFLASPIVWQPAGDTVIPPSLLIITLCLGLNYYFKKTNNQPGIGNKLKNLTKITLLFVGLTAFKSLPIIFSQTIKINTYKPINFTSLIKPEMSGLPVFFMPLAAFLFILLILLRDNINKEDKSLFAWFLTSGLMIISLTLFAGGIFENFYVFTSGQLLLSISTLLALNMALGLGLLNKLKIIRGNLLLVVLIAILAVSLRQISSIGQPLLGPLIKSGTLVVNIAKIPIEWSSKAGLAILALTLVFLLKGIAKKRREIFSLREKIAKYGLAATAFIISLGFYIFTLSPTISAGDSTEMTTAALTLGVTHQPSYPLYITIAHFFSLLPIGTEPAWRINLLSAIFESLTVVVIYFVIIKLYELIDTSFGTLRSPTKKEEFVGSPRTFPNTDTLISNTYALNPSAYLLAFSSSLFLAFSLNFWQYGTKAEVFALNNLLVSLVLLSVLTAIGKTNKSWFYLTAFLFGLAVTHHPTAIIVIPAVLFIIFSQKIGFVKNKSFLVKGGIAGLLGFIIYYYLLTSLARSNPLLNWGNPVDLIGVLRALTRVDYGALSAFVQGQQIVNTTLPLDQIRFYIDSIMSDFTWFGVLLGILGLVYSFKTNKRIFWFLSLGLSMGILFLAYANFPLGDTFNQATTKRFQLLPDIFLGLFISMGLLFLWQLFLKLGLSLKEKINLAAYGLVLTALSLVFTTLLISNFSKADARGNYVTLKYAETFYLPTESNSIILLSGDVSNFAAYYVKTVEALGDNRIVFTPGQFHLKWLIPQLKSRYPDLVIPPPLSGNRWTTTSQIIETNIDRRPIYISPELAMYDPEVEKKYVLWPSKLLFKVGKRRTEAKVETYQDESLKIWESVPMAEFSRIKKNGPLMDEIIIGYYARYFHNLGYMFDSVKLYDDAVREYKRALDIDPTLLESYKSLGLLYGYKINPPDYQNGVNYLSRYLNSLPAIELEKIQSTQGAIQELQYRAYQEAAREASPSGQPKATNSAEIKEATTSGTNKQIPNTQYDNKKYK